VSAIPALRRQLVIGRDQSWDGAELPDPRLLDLPERVVQFGTGGLLRGLIDAMLHDANCRGDFDGRVVAIQSTNSGCSEVLNRQDGLFTLRVEGVDNGATRRESRVIASISRALSASDEWAAVLECARNPELELVFSNTTEVGITLDEDDAGDPACIVPKSFPAKLTRFLHERAQAFDFDAAKGVIVLPCELIDRNGQALRDIVLTLTRRWRLGSAFERWLLDSVVFCNTLVDRIVAGTPRAPEAGRINGELGYRDDLITVCEPYRFFAIEAGPAVAPRLRFARPDIGAVVVDDITPYRERKLRILNGGHTTLASLGLLAGFDTVREAVGDTHIGRLVKAALFEEIVPVVPADGAADFAREVLDRFANPFIDHQLRDITLHGGIKMSVRVVPSIVGYAQHTGRAPSALALGFAAYLAYVRGDSGRRSWRSQMARDEIGERLAARWRPDSLRDDATTLAFVRGISGDVGMWGTDLAMVPGFADLVARYLTGIHQLGVIATIEASLAAREESQFPVSQG